MAIENHVVSLDLSRKLKELGVPQTSSLFHWHETPGEIKLFSGSHDDDCKGVAYSAFLASELGEMLPRGSYSWNTLYGWTAAARQQGREDVQVRTIPFPKTEPDARAELLIHLIENHIIDPKSLTKEEKL